MKIKNSINIGAALAMVFSALPVQKSLGQGFNRPDIINISINRSSSMREARGNRTRYNTTIALRGEGRSRTDIFAIIGTIIRLDYADTRIQRVRSSSQQLSNAQGRRMGRTQIIGPFPESTDRNRRRNVATRHRINVRHRDWRREEFGSVVRGDRMNVIWQAQNAGGGPRRTFATTGRELRRT